MLLRNLGRSFFLSILILAVGAAGLAIQATVALAAPGELSGTIFLDADEDGAVAGEQGLAGVTATAYDPSGAAVGSATSDATGAYTISGLTDGTEYRVEFTGLPAGYTDGPSGVDSETSVTFATPEASGVDFGVIVPEDCPQVPANALIQTYAAAVSCSAVFDPAYPKDSFGLLDISSTVPATGRVDQTTATPMFHHPDWHIDQIGNVFGTAIDNTRGDMFAAASSNYSQVFYDNTPDVATQAAIVQYGAIGGGAEDLGAAGTLYKMDAVTGAPSVFVQLPQQASTITHIDCESNTTIDRTTGPGLGNVVYDTANDQLFVSNWEDGFIYRLDMNGNILDAYDPDQTDNGAAGMATDRVPFALETANDGSRIYFGTVLGREVWSIDLDSSGGFTGTPSTIGGVTVYENSASETLNQVIPVSLAGELDPAWLNNNLMHFVSDLEILPSGEMMVGMRIGCSDNPHGAYNHQGQTHVLTDGGTGIYGNDQGSLNVSATGDAGLEDNYGGVDYYENPTTGTTQYAVTSADILVEAGPHGLAVFEDLVPGGTALVDPLGAIDYGAPNDPKGVAGDVSVFNPYECTPSLVEIGNRVWLDLDNDGIQDPGELSLEGVTVTLYAADGVTVLATTTTDANGEYYFTEADGVDPNTSYVVGFDATTTTSTLPGGAAASDLVATMSDVGSTSAPDLTDSDLVGTTISVTTGDPGENDHSYDAGFTLPYDLALTKVYTSDTFGNTTDGVIEDGADVTFTIEVTNQGALDATTFGITDYLPAGFVLNDAAWTDNGDGTATISGGPLAAGASTPFTITLTATGAADGDHVNWAEISDDDGNDVDSTPDTNPADDTQPAAPGDPTDNVIDNTAGDSDDHDPAGVTIVSYDLALIKVYTSDTFGAPTDGVIEMGADVTFTITVTNQGTIDATTFDVTDSVPAGFTLNDAAWTDNGDGSATITGGPLAAGASVDIPITMTATSSGAGDLINTAEISADDGDDVDSTPDADPADDNQPAAPGDPTDNVIDNTPDGNGAADSDDHDIAGVTVDAYDLALTKVYTSDTFGAPTDGVIDDGTDVTFTITVTNQGTVDATTFDITDYIPAGFVLNDAAWTDNGDSTATISGGPLAAGATQDFTITMTADGAAQGDYVNWAEIAGDDGNDVDSTPDSTQGNDNQPGGPGDPTDNVIDNTADAAGDPDEDDHDPAGITVGTYDLALTKVYTSDTSGLPADGVIQDGADVTFTITVTNQGTLDAATFDVTDYIPAGFVLNDAAWTDNGDGTATISGGPLAAGVSIDIPITVTASGAALGDSVNWAEISADDGSDVDSTPDTDPADDAQPAGPGDPTDNVTDNTAGDSDDHDPAGVTVAEYDLALQKVYTSDTTAPTADGVVSPGDDVVFTITVTNQGTLDAATFDVTDYVPAGFTLNDAAWTDNGDGTATTTGGPLAAGASTDFTIRLTADAGIDGDFVNWAEISSADGVDVDSTPDSTQGNDNQPVAPGDPTDNVIDNSLDVNGAADEDDHDPAGITVATYDLALQKVYTSDTFGSPTDGIIEQGADVTFTITVTNQGTLDATTFDVTDYIPAGFVLNDAAWTDNGDGTATIAGGPLTVGASVDITLTTTATSSTPGSFENWAEISDDDGQDVDSIADADQANDNQPAAAGDPTDGVIDNSPDGSGDPDEDDHDVAAVAIANYDLALQKVYTSDSAGAPTDGVIEPGSDVVFTITVTNQGTLDATTFDVTDYIPSGFVLSAGEVALGAWTDNGDGTATITGGPLAAGASTDITITLTANGAPVGDYVNWAEISADDGNDIDSTPDTDPADDAQPAGPGEPTDNVIDNTPDGNGIADSDDHDPAGVTLANYDLALTKVYTSDTYNNATDGEIADGADVTFTITVTNQGTLDAASFDVTDYIPVGFVLSAGEVALGAWTDNGDGTATISGGPLAAGVSIDIPITLTASGAPLGDSVNWAEISADDGSDVDSTPDTDPADDVQPAGPGDPTDNVIDNTAGDSDDHDPAGVTVVEYDLALIKLYTSDTSGAPTDGVVEAGGDVTFTITVTNQGTVDATTFDVTDFIPSGFTLNDAAWTDNGDGTATTTAGPLAAGASTDIQITMTAGSIVPGVYVNWAEISADDGDDVDSTTDTDQANDNQPAAPGDPTDNVIDNTSGDEDDQDPAGVTFATYDLALQKVYTSDTFGAPTDGIIESGADVTFTITVTNQGTLDAASFEVTDYLPAGFALNDGAWTDNGDGTATISGGPLAAGASVDITLTTTATSSTPGSFENWAEISADDGQDVDSTADATQANDNQPAAAGDPTDNVIDNTADGNGDPDEDDHDVAAVAIANYDLALQKVYTSDSAGAPNDGVIEPGADVTFTITVTNQGTLDATTFDVTDYMPTGFVLNDAAWTDNGNGTATISGGPLAAGATQDFTITLTANGAPAGDYVNWAEISADDGNDIDSTPDTDPADDAQPAAPGDPTDDVIDNAPDGNGIADSDDHDPAGVTVATYDLALTKVYTSDTGGAPTDGVINNGDDVTFTIEVTNQGTIDATTLDVTDYIPAGFVLNDAAWTDNGDGTATITAGPVVAGRSIQLSITLTATAAPTGDSVNWAEISADDGNDVDSTPDTDPADDNQPAGPEDLTDNVIDNTAGDSDDHDPAGVTVANYDLALTKVYTSDTSGASTDGVVEPGDDVTFTITVFNQGTVDATTIEVTDYLPAGFDLNDAAWTDNGDGTATITAGPIVAGRSIDIPITLTANGAPDGDHVNWAEISADDGADTDSTPDTDPADDVQPAGPGDPTDNVVDNTAGDSDDHDPAGITVASYDLALTKVYTSDTFAAPTDGIIENGADVTFTIEVTNQGTIDATTFEVTDYIPAGFVLNDAAWTDNGDGTATISGGPLAAGASELMTITLTATAATPGTIENWAEISADDGDDVDSTTDAIQANDNQPAASGAPTDNVIDNTAGDEDDHDVAGVSIANYDLALIKVYTSDTYGNASDGFIENGTDVTFTITVTNQGTLDATTFEVTDYIPTGFTLNDAAWTDNGDGTATIAGRPLAAGASTDITITLTASGAADGDYVNWAEISADDGNDIDSTPDTDPADDAQPVGPGAPTDNEVNNTAGDSDDHDPAPISVGSFDLALTKVYTSDTFGASADGIIADGADVTFTITVTNQGTIDATTFDVTDYIPAGFVLNDAAWTDNGDGTATTSGGPLATGATQDIDITLTANGVTPGDYVNWAEISADDGNDIDSTPDTDPADDNQPAAPGDPTDNEVNNAAGDEDDHDPAGVSVANYDLALTKVYTSDTFGLATDGVVQAGSDVTFTITVTNQGTIDATTFAVTDYIPAGFVLNDAAWTDNGDGTATIAGRPLAAGASADITITMTADSPAPGGNVNGAEISADDGADIDSTPDTDPADDNQPAAPGDPTDDVIDNSNGDEDDHDIAGVEVVIYDLALVKAYTSDTFGDTSDGVIENGADVTFTISVTNQGTIDATTFDVTDYIPAGFVLNDAAWTDNGDGTATTTGRPLAAGASTDITITLTATTATPGDSVNWAEISADDGDDVDSTPDTDPADDNQPGGPGDPTDDVIDNTAGDSDDHDPAGVQIVNYDLALTKVYTSDTHNAPTDGVVENGADVTFTITITNQGTVDATTINVTDYLPVGFLLNDAAWTDNGDGTASTTAGPIPAGGTLDIPITMTADAVVPGDAVNGAEISADDGTDVDSTPDTDPADDNQPAAPGDPTDDEVNNAAGDEDDHDIAGVSVELYDLALTKVYTSDTFAAPADGVIDVGADVVFTITVTNQGTVDATTFDVTDHIPTGFTLNDAAWTDNGDGTATITGGPLAAGATQDFTITMTAGAVVPGSYVNWAEISADDGNDVDSTPDADVTNDAQPSSPGDPTDNVTDNTAGDEDDHDPAAVGVENFDLALIKVLTDDRFGDPADGLTENGADVTFTVTVINQGTIDATTFDVTDFIPAGFVLNDAAWTDNGDGTATISGGPLAAGDSTDITITMTANAAATGVSVNGAEISADDGNDIDSTPDTDPADDNQPAAPGDPTDDVTNNVSGDSDDHDIAGVTIGEFDLALTKVYTSDTQDAPNDGVVESGADVVFTITVTNQGTLDADTFDVTDYIPAGLTLNDAAWTDNGDSTATITGGPLAAGASVDIPITLTVDATTAGQLVNGAEISSDTATDIDSTPDNDPADDNQPTAPGDPTDDEVNNAAGDEDDHDIAGLTVDVYDLALVKDFTSDTSADGNSTDGVIQAGDDATFTITVTNEGTVTAAAFDITDYLPIGFVLNDASWTDNGNNTATTSVAGPLAPGASTSVTITLTAATPGAGPLVNWAEISSDEGDDIDSTPNTSPNDDGTPPSEDDIDDAPLTVDAYDLALRKVYTSDTSADGLSTDGTITAGDDITFTITVYNQGTVDAANIEVTDFMPAGLSLNDAAWTDNGDGTAMTTIAAIAAGTSVDVTITLTADNPTIGAQLNAAEISNDDGSDIDSTPNADVNDDGPITDDEINNAAGDEDDHDPAPFMVVEEIVPVFDLALRKRLQNGANSGTVSIGDTVTWTVTVFNQGEVNAANIDVIDYIPSGLDLADSAWTENADGNAVINIAGPIAPGASASVDITTTVVDGSDLTNLAEIASADPVDAEGVVLVLANGLVVPDVDSIADDSNSETPVDDVVDNANGDEDDHDLATVVLVSTETPPAPPLAVTGTTWTIVFLSWALGLFFLGAALVLFARKEEDELAYGDRHGKRRRNQR